jgi:thioredoxin 2
VARLGFVALTISRAATAAFGDAAARAGLAAFAGFAAFGAGFRTACFDFATSRTVTPGSDLWCHRPMRRVCSECKAINRIPVRHLADTGKCGKCQARLPPQGQPIEISSEGQFDDIVAASRVPVLVDFWAPWCGPCRAVAPEVKKAAHNLAGKALVLKVDTDELGDLAQRYQIQSIPNFALFTGGRLVRQRAGAIDHRQLERWAVAPQ